MTYAYFFGVDPQSDVMKRHLVPQTFRTEGVGIEERG